MTVTKLKTKSQLTIPRVIVRRLGLKPNDLFSVEVEANFIKLTPVKLEPKYGLDGFEAVESTMGKIVSRVKVKGIDSIGKR